MTWTGGPPGYWLTRQGPVLISQMSNEHLLNAMARWARKAKETNTTEEMLRHPKWRELCEEGYRRILPIGLVGAEPNKPDLDPVQADRFSNLETDDDQGDPGHR